MNYGLNWESPTMAVLWIPAAAVVGAWSWYLLRDKPRRLAVLRTAAIGLVALSLLKTILQRVEPHRVRPRAAVLIDTGLSMSSEDGVKQSRLSRAVRWLESHRRDIEARADPVLYAGADRARRVSWDELDRLSPADAAFNFGGALKDISDASASESFPPARLWLLSDGNSESGGDVGGDLAHSQTSASTPGGIYPPSAAGKDVQPLPAAAVPDDVSGARWKTPVDAAGIGPKSTTKSAALEELKTPDFVFLHSRFPVAVTLEAAQLQGSQLKVELWKGTSMVTEQTLSVHNAYEILNATFTASAESLGRERYRLEVKGSEIKAASREFGVEVIRQKHRIMYLAGRPSFEYVHLREQLKANPNFELVSFVILRNPENIAPVLDNELSLIPFPAQEIFVQSLSQFDIFILENFAYWRFNLPVTYLENLKRFVAQGGALLVIGGSNAYAQGGYRSTPLEEALPVTLWNSPDDFVPGLFKPKLNAPAHPLLQLADSTEEAEALWKMLPALDGFNRFSGVRNGATVLLTHPSEKTPSGAHSQTSASTPGGIYPPSAAGKDVQPLPAAAVPDGVSGAPMPLLAIRDYGKGKVMVLGTDSTWRWKLGGGEQWKISPFYGRFWERAVQYLTGTLDLKKVKFSPLPDRLPPREPAVVVLHLFDASFGPLSGSEADLRVQWTAPGGRSQAVFPREKEPGVFEIELTGLQEGVHRLRAVARYHGQVWGEDEIRFNWDLRASAAPLQRRWLQEVAQRTDGRYADLDRVPLSDWLEGLPKVRTEREVLQRWPVWDSSAWLWAILVLLVVEWLLRRRLGYV